MNVLSALSLIIFPFYVFMGCYVYKLDPKSSVNRVFMLLAFCFSVWAFTFAFFYEAPDHATAWLWYNLSSIGRYLYPAVMLTLALIFTRNRINSEKWFNPIVLFIPTFIFLYATFTGPFITQDLVFLNGKWYEIFITNNVWWYTYNLYYMGYLAVSLLILGWWGYRSKNSRERNQALIVLTTGITAIVLGIITNTVFQYFNSYLLPSMAQIIGVIFFTGISYAIVRYKLLKLTATAAADQIISKITDLVILIDIYGVIITTNTRTRSLLGYTYAELECQSWEVLIRDDKDRAEVDRYINSRLIEEDEKCKIMEVEINTKNGGFIPVNIYISGVKDEFGIIGVLMVAQDLRQTKKLQHEIREKNIAQKSAKAHEEGLKKSLNEKELLLKEIHHRVKNNMQIISSLLNLQSSYLKDEEAISALKESQARIVSMAMIHENLYRSDNLSGINFENYINHLIRNLFHTYNMSMEKIHFNIQASNVFLDIDTAIPCGLMVNELVTNAIKHAFPWGTSGEITIHMEQDHDEYHLEISDNGVGLPPELDINNSPTLGLLLVNSLMGQLEGKLELNRENGTCFHVNFKKLDYKDRL